MLQKCNQKNRLQQNTLETRDFKSLREADVNYLLLKMQVQSPDVRFQQPFNVL